jgi:L-alanine-DL-glutamate epimerase-like enolase superfamily enzyme
LDLLNVYLLEEALPRNDIEGLDIIANSVEMMMVGGEHTPTVLDFKPHLVSGAHDVQQPDITLMGNFGITGLKEVSRVANFYRHQIIPHVYWRRKFLHYAGSNLTSDGHRRQLSDGRIPLQSSNTHSRDAAIHPG